MRARTIAVVVPVVIGVALAPSRARAAGPTQTGFALDTFEPSARGSDWFVLDSLDFRGDSRGAVGTVYEYADKPFVVKNAGGADRGAIVSHQLYVHAGASFVIQDRVRLSSISRSRSSIPEARRRSTGTPSPRRDKLRSAILPSPPTSASSAATVSSSRAPSAPR